MKLAVPQGSSILDGLDRPVDYADCFRVTVDLEPECSVDAVTRATLTEFPRWALGLMWLRNRLVRPFRLRTGGDVPSTKPDGLSGPIDRDLRYGPGDRAVFFTVLQRSDDEIVMGEQDRHLDFRVSVRVPRRDEGNVDVEFITVVVFNNPWGRLYFFPVKPFHRAIVRSLLARMARRAARPS
jgi:hypothetical protein